MTDLSVEFSNPWLLLLIIPAVAFTLIPYFRLSKKYRRTRNRIMSMALHMIVMLCAIGILSGMNFRYDVPNTENEVILLVDVSDTGAESEAKRDAMIETVLADSKMGKFKIGIVTFGFDQCYAAPLTYDVDEIYSQYKNAAPPDTSATDIAAALTYASDLFTKPESGKIVLITDGKETDQSALDSIVSVSAKGVSVDTAYISSQYSGDDIQLSGVTLPEYHLKTGEEFSLSLNVSSKSDAQAVITMYDNGEKAENAQTVQLIEGAQVVTFKHTFETLGIHKLSFTANAGSNDSVEGNNIYNSYVFLESFNKVLIVEREAGESDALLSMLDEAGYDANVVNIRADDNVPSTVKELLAYDQVILNNISNADMTVGFDEMLYDYVKTYGGGLFTVGGNDENGEANAYNRKDMYGTVYQSMLPVEAVNYSPPVGVIVIVDRSGSMGSTVPQTGDTLLYWALEGAKASFRALSERDYFGLMTIDDLNDTVLELTPRTEEAKILSAINSIELGGGTVVTGAIERAGQQLRALDKVDKKHVILITDGLISEDQVADYEKLINDYYLTDGITFSVVGISVNSNSDAGKQLERAAEIGHGRAHFVEVKSDMGDLIEKMREDVKAKDIVEINYETFSPIIADASSALFNNVERSVDADNKNVMDATLDGFYGAKVRSKDYLVLTGEYEVPIYAQWKFGNGMVGSFMCDLQGVWSNDFINNINGKTFLLNVVDNLMPTKNIRPVDINIKLDEENYYNRLSITKLGEGDSIEAEIVSLASDSETPVSLNAVTGDNSRASVYVTLALTAENNYSRCIIVVRESGFYKITITRKDADGNVLSTHELYKVLSFSKEYDNFEEPESVLPDNLLDKLAVKGGGTVIEDITDPYEVFSDFITKIEKEFDPRYMFAIIAIVALLLDIAVRKFKFKWPHELIREYKAGKAEKSS